MTQIEALEWLIEEIKAETLNPFICGATAEAYPTNFPFNGEALTLTTALDAFRGSLDAAKSLHEELLPEWEARPVVGGKGAGVELWRCEIEEVDSGRKVFAGNVANPARAWLLTIFRAIASELGSEA